MSSFTRSLSSATLVAALAALAACGDSSSASTGRISLKLTDAPGDVQKAVVTIDSIYLQSGADSTSSNGRIYLMTTPRTTDLLTLRDSIADLVSDAVVPSGTYHQLRFKIRGAYIVVDDGNGATSTYATPGYDQVPAGTSLAGSLQTPSWSSSGFKVKLPGDQVTIAGDSKVLLVDFDVSRSFRERGNGNWIVSPVIQATEFVTSGTVNASLSAADTVHFPSINGTPVSLAGFSAVLTIDSSRKLVPLTDANGDGTFEASFRYLAPGTYALDFVAPSDSVRFTTNPSRPASVTVGSGAVAAQAFTLTSASK